MTVDEAHLITKKYSDRVDKNIKKLLSNYMDKNNSLFYTKDLGNPNNRQRVHQSLKRVQRNKWPHNPPQHSSLEVTAESSLINHSVTSTKVNNQEAGGSSVMSANQPVTIIEKKDKNKRKGFKSS
jgi:hypothetical protein